jgi:hypothetical protein
MKQHWDVDPLPPPEGNEDGLDGFSSYTLLVFVAVGPMLYFGPELRVMEKCIAVVYRALESWLSPIRDLLLR